MIRDQIDASVFVEHLFPVQMAKKQRILKESCRRYIDNLTERDIEASLSYGALGEIWLAIHNKVQKENQETILQKMNELLYECKIIINAPTYETHKKVIEIHEIDTRIKPSDALRLAETCTLERERFITVDAELLESKRLQEFLGIKIVPPN